jgi:polar amino acid transport system substrate-binding protein
MKQILFVFLLLLSLFITGHNAYSQNLEDVVRFVTVEFAPYEFEEQENDVKIIKGIQVDMVKRMCELAGIRYSIELLPFKRAYKEVLNLEKDCIFNFYKNPERLTLFDYTDPLLNNPLVIFVKKGEETKIRFTGKVEELKGYQIGVMLGYTYSPEFDEAIKNNTITVNPVPSHDINFQKLSHKRIDMYICEQNVGLYTAKKIGVAEKIAFLETPFKIQQGYLGIAKNNPKKFIIEKLNAALKQIKDSGEYSSFFDKYLK